MFGLLPNWPSSDTRDTHADLFCLLSSVLLHCPHLILVLVVPTAVHCTVHLSSLLACVYAHSMSSLPLLVQSLFILSAHLLFVHHFHLPTLSAFLCTCSSCLSSVCLFPPTADIPVHPLHPTCICPSALDHSLALSPFHTLA